MVRPTQGQLLLLRGLLEVLALRLQPLELGALHVQLLHEARNLPQVGGGEQGQLDAARALAGF